MAESQTMRNLTVTLPLVTNTGEASDYHVKFMDLLEENGLAAWTETFARGTWRGVAEEVTMFTFYVPIDSWRYLMAHFGLWARMAAPDQEAIMVTDLGEITVTMY
jgi:hypothetical protein